MAVALDTSLAQGSSAGATSHGYLVTIGAGSNMAMLAFLTWTVNPGAITVMQWDAAGSPQTMAQVLAPVASSDNVYVAIYGLVAPVTGTKVFQSNWTNAAECLACVVSLTGADQTGGTTTFAHATSSSGSSTTPSVTITSATGNMTIDIASSGHSAHPTSPSKTSLWGIDGSGAVNASGSYAAGAASNVHSWTLSPTNPWVSGGVDIVAVGGGAAAGNAGSPLLAGYRNTRVIS